MKINEIINEDKNPCWDNYKQIGMKMKNGKKVPNCVPKEGVAEGSREQVDPSTVWEVCFDYGPHQSDKVKVRASSQEEAEQKGMRAAKKLGHRFPQLNWAMPVEQGVAEDWQKTNKQDKTDGMSSKAVKAYRRENPGSKLQTAVTKKPSDLKPGSKDAKRRKSFCARMSGVDGPMKDEKGRPTPKAKALKRWNC